MADAPILILPGLDGSDLMLGQFRQLCANDGNATVETLPDDDTMGYPELAVHFSPVIRDLSKCHIIAESFSGPIGILLAARYPEIVNRLTLVASFATSPVPRIASILPWSMIFQLPMPSSVAKHFFVGRCKSLIPVLRSAVRQSAPATLRHRLRLVQNVDVTEELSGLNCHLSYIRPTSDRLIPQRCLDQILDVYPATIVHEIDGPHLILETQPENSWRQIAE
ncbi:alpha/beta fold hydrolase [Adhaeretor mobilis]|uniref:Aminoacrylate hydrolase RutD n=1 Tax=Adhaeretor mobilis TaxID=1930276 RepID=A0A517MRW5_9BACT|nr:alpha/beta hydrolase [Adhaeretor mobilis]QDS97614.1 Putative aminoacrylate hydrolase RutD [Adhaeretor mobilis]